MRFSRICALILSILLVLTAFLGGCPGAVEMGQVRVLVTDKPYPYEFIASATLTITRVDVRTGDPTQEREESFITIFEGAREFDLMDLQNGQTDLLADAAIPAGTYTQMRLFVTEGAVTLTTGPDPIALSVSSGAASGIKLNFTFTVQPEAQTELLLDVDMSRAFRPVPAGNITDPSTIREFHFAPALGMRLINILEAGSIAGTVTDHTGNPLAQASVTAFDEGGNEITSSSTEADGTYVLAGLNAGTYRVEASANTFFTGEATGIEVSAGQQVSDVNFSLQPVE